MLAYTLFQNGRHFSVLLFTYKLALVASFLNSKFKRIFSFKQGTRANLQVNKRILKWRPFWNKVYTNEEVGNCCSSDDHVKLSNICIVSNTVDKLYLLIFFLFSL